MALRLSDLRFQIYNAGLLGRGIGGSLGLATLYPNFYLFLMNVCLKFLRRQKWRCLSAVPMGLFCRSHVQICGFRSTALGLL